MIGLCGAHRTGKTTLARAYAERVGIPFVETDARGTFARLGFDPKADYSFGTRMEIQLHILHDAGELYRKAGSRFITDRTPIDFLAYTLADVQRTTLSNPSEERTLEEYLKACFDCCNRHFTTLIVVQPGIAIQDAPGKAPASAGYIEHLNSLMLGLVVNPHINAYHFSINRKFLDIEERLSCVQYAVDESGRMHKARTQREIEEGKRPAMVS